MRKPICGVLLAASMALPMPAFAAGELDAFAKAIDQNPDDAASYEGYGQWAIREKRFDDAIARLKVGVARIPGFARGYYLLAIAYRNKGAFVDAADFYRCYLVLNPQGFDSYYGLAKSLEGMKDNKGALANYEKYIELEKRPAYQKFVDDAKASVARLEGGGAPAAATATAPAAAPAGPSPAELRATAKGLFTDAQSLYKAGKVPDAEKKYSEAAAAYQRAIAADPNNVENYADLGNIYYSQKKYGDAATEFRTAVAKDPKYALGWYNLAYALRKAGKGGEAVEALRTYIKLKPDDPDPYYQLGQTLKGLGDLNGAADAFKKYIEMQKRPDQQAWVEKAKNELQAIEAQLHPAAPPSPGPGKIGD